MAENACIGDELSANCMKKGAAEATPFLSILLQDILLHPTRHPELVSGS